MMGLGYVSIFASIINWLLIALFFGGLIALGVWFVTRLTRIDGSSNKLTPMDIVRQCYAKGEITKEQFEQIKKDLN